MAISRMTPTCVFLWSLIIGTGVCFWVPATSAIAQDTDPSEEELSFTAIPEIDDEVRRCMQAIGATAATMAVSHDGRIVYSKGYGYSDRNQRIPTSPRSTMRLASCTKPFTAAAIEILIKRGDISRDIKVYDYLDIKPFRKLVDERIRDITVAHLLDHRGGWDRDQTFDPIYEIDTIKKTMGIRRLRKQHIVRYMWNNPLQVAPGSEEHYSNFGYLLLGMVIEKATGKSYVNSIRELITEPTDAGEIFISSPIRENRKSREVHYPEENQLDFHLRDSASGLATTTETLCYFMSHYWLTGAPLDRRRLYYYQFGSQAFTTTTIMEQRLDRVHFAIMFNRRRNDTYNEDNDAIRTRINRILDSTKEQLIRD